MFEETRESMQKRIEALEDECSYIRGQRDAQKSFTDRAEQERDAALEREQDKAAYAQQLRLDYQALCEKLTSAEEREQALAAHVARLKEVFFTPGEGAARMISIGNIFQEPISVSHARRDAEQRGKGIEDAASRWPLGSATRSRLLELAEDARLKAKGGA